MKSYHISSTGGRGSTTRVGKRRMIGPVSLHGRVLGLGEESVLHQLVPRKTNLEMTVIMNQWRDCLRIGMLLVMFYCLWNESTRSFHTTYVSGTVNRQWMQCWSSRTPLKIFYRSWDLPFIICNTLLPMIAHIPRFHFAELLFNRISCQRRIIWTNCELSLVPCRIMRWFLLLRSLSNGSRLLQKKTEQHSPASTSRRALWELGNGGTPC